MTIKELVTELNKFPEDCEVTVNGYEGGTNIINIVHEPRDLLLNQHVDWWYGKHEYRDSYTDEDIIKTSIIVKAVHLES